MTGRVVILSVMWLWKLQQTVKSEGICSNLAGFNDGRIIYCEAGSLRCHMSMASRTGTGLHIRGEPPADRPDQTDTGLAEFQSTWPDTQS